jgi:hypothetical protein
LEYKANKESILNHLKKNNTLKAKNGGGVSY